VERNGRGGDPVSSAEICLGQRAGRHPAADTGDSQFLGQGWCNFWDKPTGPAAVGPSLRRAGPGGRGRGRVAHPPGQREIVISTPTNAAMYRAFRRAERKSSSRAKPHTFNHWIGRLSPSFRGRPTGNRADSVEETKGRLPPCSESPIGGNFRPAHYSRTTNVLIARLGKSGYAKIKSSNGRPPTPPPENVHDSVGTLTLMNCDFSVRWGKT